MSRSRFGEDGHEGRVCGEEEHAHPKVCYLLGVGKQRLYGHRSRRKWLGLRGRGAGAAGFEKMELRLRVIWLPGRWQLDVELW